jgi:hypothetical protein
MACVTAVVIYHISGATRVDLRLSLVTNAKTGRDHPGSALVRSDPGPVPGQFLFVPNNSGLAVSGSWSPSILASNLSCRLPASPPAVPRAFRIRWSASGLFSLARSYRTNTLRCFGPTTILSAYMLPSWQPAAYRPAVPIPRGTLSPTTHDEEAPFRCKCSEHEIGHPSSARNGLGGGCHLPKLGGEDGRKVAQQQASCVTNPPIHSRTQPVGSC